MKTWTDQEVCILQNYYNAVSNEELYKLLPSKSAQGIYKKAYKLGFRKSADIEYLNRSLSKTGQKASNWKGGFRTTQKGYRQLLIPGHARADINGYVMEHIAVFEKETGINIPLNCCIHHLNGDKSDNRIENLCMMLTGAHTTYHHQGRHLSDDTKQKISIARRKYIA